MIRVLIAEDELPLLRGIKAMIEQLDSSYRVLCCAKNGREAADYISQHDIDILFTDINMPVMNGFSLLSFMAQHNRDIPAVIISGYHDFEYARTAIKFGVKNYLLKPVDRQELAQLMTKLRDEIASRSYMQKRDFLVHLLFSSGGQPIPADVSWKELRMVYLCAGSYQGSEDADEIPDYDFWNKDTLTAFLRGRLLPQGGDAWTFWGTHPNEAMVILEGATDFSFMELLEQLRTNAAPECITLAAGKAGVRPELLLQESRELRKRIKYGVIFGQSGILTSELTEKNTSWANMDFGTVQLSVQKGQQEVFETFMRHCMNRLKQSAAPQYSLELTLEAALAFLQQELNVAKEQSPRQIARGLVRHSPDYDSLANGFFTIVSDLFQNIIFDTGNKDALMQAVDKHILKNISTPLTTKELSQKFGLVPPYLSSLFKAYKGLSPAQYIQNIRMESAKKMLVECPRLLIKDIADALGYSNALYFSKTFYKNTGMYPSEYKMHCLQKNKA